LYASYLVKSGDPGQARAGVHSTRSKPAHARRRRRLRWKIFVGLGVVVAVWGVAVIVDVTLAGLRVENGQADVQSARQGLSANGILSGSPVGGFMAAAGNFESAHELLSSPLLWPVDVAPIIGRQMHSVQDLSQAAERVAHTGVTTARRAQGLLDLPHAAGPERVAVLRQLATLASATQATLNGVDLGPDQGLLWPVAEDRATFLADLNQVRVTLMRTNVAATAAADILQGPRTFLLLAGNNAEMRAGSGAFLEAGIVTTDDGQLHLGQMVPTSTLTLPRGAVSVGGDLEARWGWLLPGVDWRNLGLTPQFDVTAPLAARMWRALTGQKVDGVFAIDVGGLRDILAVTGPVTTASGEVVQAADVDELLLHDQYDGESYSANSVNRVDELSTLASATLHALQTRSLDLRSLLNALSSATEGRHILVWSADPRVESVWREVGISGQLSSNSLVATVINRGGNKLDQYLSVTSSLRLTPRGDETDGRLVLTLSNRTPAGQSPFIAGPYPGLGTHYGEYVGIATVNVPGSARNISSPSARLVVTNGREGPTVLIGTSIDIPVGKTQTLTLYFVLPHAHGTLTVVPSARMPAVTWRVGTASFKDEKPHSISW
jgi:hypothetical protein